MNALIRSSAIFLAMAVSAMSFAAEDDAARITDCLLYTSDAADE